MNWMLRLMEEYGFKSRYELAKKTGIGESSVNRIISRDSDWKNTKLGFANRLAKGLGLTVDELIEKLEQYEKDNN